MEREGSRKHGLSSLSAPGFQLGVAVRAGSPGHPPGELLWRPAEDVPQVGHAGWLLRGLQLLVMRLLREKQGTSTAAIPPQLVMDDFRVYCR